MGLSWEGWEGEEEEEVVGGVLGVTWIGCGQDNDTAQVSYSMED